METDIMDSLLLSSSSSNDGYIINVFTKILKSRYFWDISYQHIYKLYHDNDNGKKELQFFSIFKRFEK